MKKLLVLFLLVLSSCSYWQETKEVTWQETRPSVVLKKYEYFKKLSSRLDMQRANLELLKEQLESPNLSQDWKQNIVSQMIGVSANYNNLAAIYNEEMSKINYAFCNVGKMPISNLEPLPREFTPYILTLKK